MNEEAEKIAGQYYDFTVKQGWKLAGSEREIRKASYEFAKQICQPLEPKPDEELYKRFPVKKRHTVIPTTEPYKPTNSPDEGRLLKIDEIKANPVYNEYLKTMSYGEAQRACQRDLTASIKEAEWQAKLAPPEVLEATIQLRVDDAIKRNEVECQARGERILLWIRGFITLLIEGGFISREYEQMLWDKYEALKQEGVKR